MGALSGRSTQTFNGCVSDRRAFSCIGESLREQFIKLYSQPLLEDLEVSIRHRYPNVEVCPHPGYARVYQETTAPPPHPHYVAAFPSMRASQVPPIPTRGAFDITRVRGSPYFFS